MFGTQTSSSDFLIGFRRQGAGRPSKPASGRERTYRTQASPRTRLFGPEVELAELCNLRERAAIRAANIIAHFSDAVDRARLPSKTFTPTATSCGYIVEELQPPQAKPESNPFLACNAVKMDKKREGDEDDAPAIDPNDGGSMRGEKMVSSRVDVTSEHKTSQCQRRCAP